MLAASVFVVALARRIGWPSILGYLVVGMVLGPHALRLITQADTISDLAELGVVFLLFTLGLEFSLPRMMAVHSLWPGVSSFGRPRISWGSTPLPLC